MKAATSCFRRVLRSFLILPLFFMLALLAGRHSTVFGVDNVLRGDANADGVVSLSDALLIQHFQWLSGPPPSCLAASDANGDSKVNIADPVTIVNALFLQELLPPEFFDPSDNCESYDVLPPPETEDVIRLGSVVASAGERVAIPVFLTNSQDVEGMQLVIRFDPSVFTPIREPVSFEGTFYGGVAVGIARAEVFDDTLLVTFAPVFDLFPPPEGAVDTPPGEDTVVFKIVGTIREESVPGTVSPIELTNGPNGEGFGILGLRNELTHQGAALLVGQRLPGEIRITDGGGSFIRGDANADGVVDISDATTILGYLFLGATTLRCPDSADVNDDGETNITDPILLLRTLFLGLNGIAPPFPAAGVDPTPDALGPCG